MNTVNTALYNSINHEDFTMTISINATNLEILEATKIAEALGLELEFVLDEF